MKKRFPAFSTGIAENPSTGRLFDALGACHDFECYDGMTSEKLYQKIFVSHFGHLAIIFFWTSGNLFHVAWQGNFEDWVVDPLRVAPIAHAIWDPHFGRSAINAFAGGGVPYPVTLATSGVYHWWYTIGMRWNFDLYFGSMFLFIVALVFMYAGWLHCQPGFLPGYYWFKHSSTIFLHHTAGLLGVSSLAWAGHLIHVAIPESRGQHVGWDNLMTCAPHPAGLEPLWSLKWFCYTLNPDTGNHIFGTKEGAGTAILTFLGGFHPETQSMWLTDIAHHHLAIGVVAIFAGHMYREVSTIYLVDELCFKCNIKVPGLPLESNFRGSFRGTMYAISESLHLQLAVALTALGVAASLTAQHMYALPAYAFISTSYPTQISLYVHHQFIAGFLMLGAFAHGAIYYVRDFDPWAQKGTIFCIMLSQKEAIISHLSWVSLFLGFHTLGLYIHNDTCVAFGTPEKQILFEPVFAQFIQSASGKVGYGFNVLLSSSTSPASVASSNVWLPGWREAIVAEGSSLFLTLGPGDFLVHHAIALGLHTSTLILIKGALDARGSGLMPDKKDFGYSFPCDGPGRGGTCDISAWDAFYLGVFWVLNTTAWVAFYWHWRHLSLWGFFGGFEGGSTYLMGWLADYLWAGSAGVVNGYNVLGTSAASVWTWTFLFGHLVWATGFMFLISWRGYWQELIETLVWAHRRTPLANWFEWEDKPVALSIVQGRLIGLVHFTAGYILSYAAFIEVLV
jgi:photosystem I P700 chlorophyll a apoprotein A2